MNIVIQHGRIAKDPEVRYTQSGKAVATFTLAVDRPRTENANAPTADFFNYVAWGKLAETISNYGKKGTELATEGHLQNRSYETKDGSKRYVTEIILDKFDFCGSKASNANNSANVNNGQQNNGSQNNGFNGGFNSADSLNDDDIPF